MLLPSLYKETNFIRRRTLNARASRASLVGAAKAYLTRPRAVRRHDDTLAFHLLHHPRRTIVTDSQAPLDHGDRSLVGFHHDADRVIVHFIVFLIALGTAIL